MAKVRDTITWANFETRLRQADGGLNILTGQDDELQDLLDSAARAADRYMNNPFLDSAGVDIDPLPRGVQKGVIEWIRVQLAITGLAAGTGLGSVKTGDLSQVYASATTGFDRDKASMNAARTHWRSFRRRWDL